MMPHRTSRGSPTQDQARQDDKRIAQSKQQKEVSHDAVYPGALLQKKATPQSSHMAYLPRATTFNSIISRDSGYGSKESLIYPSYATRPEKRLSGLRSVCIPTVQDVDTTQSVPQEPQQPNTRQRLPSMMLFAHHRMFPFLDWLEQHISYPFPQDEEVEKLAESAQLTVPEAKVWLVCAQEKLFQYATQIENVSRPRVVQGPGCERHILPKPVVGPFRVSPHSLKTRKVSSNSRSKKPWHWMSSMTTNTTSIGALLVGIPTAFTFSLSTGEPVDLISRLKTLQNKSEPLPKHTKSIQLGPRNSLSTARKASGNIAICDSTAIYQEVVSAGKCDDSGTLIDRWFEEVVYSHSAEIKANLRRWHIASQLDQPHEDSSEKPTIELPSISGSINSDGITETDFHSLQLGERSPSYHVGASRIRQQQSGEQNVDPELGITFLSLSDNSPEDQIDSAISDTTSCLSEYDQMDLWPSEQEIFLEWAGDNMIPFLVKDFIHNSADTSVSDTDSSVRTRPAGETNRGQQHGVVRHSVSNPSGNGNGNGGKRKRDKSDEGRKLSKEPNPGAHGSEKSSGEGSTDKTWACPYHKYEPHTYSSVNIKYKSCPSGYQGINRVKGHMKRVHTPEYYCDRCKTVFRVAEEKHAHDNSTERCEEVYLREEYRDMIIGPKKEALKKKEVGRSDEYEWFRMWKVLFKLRPQPASPYQELIPEMRNFRERAERLRPRVIETFRPCLPIQLQVVPDEVLMEFYRHTIESLASDIESQIRLGTQAPSDIPRPPVDGTTTQLNAPLSISDAQTTAPWNPNTQQARDMPVRQAVAEVNATFPTTYSARPTMSTTFGHNLPARTNEQTYAYPDPNLMYPQFDFDENFVGFDLPNLDSPMHSFDNGYQP